jgi:hypothetical protein
MAYDEDLAQRIRLTLAERSEVTEQKMFGGIAFMLGGNMCCGIIRSDLMLRLGPELSTKALAEPHTRPMEMNGRPMSWMVLVSPSGYQSDEALQGWLDRAADFTASLPPKQARPTARSRVRA